MADNNTARLVAAFVCLVLGAALMNVVASSVLVNTQPTQVLLEGPTILRWGADNNIYTNVTGRTYFNASTGSSMASSIFANANPSMSCGGLDAAHSYLYNGTTTAPGTNLGASGAGNWTITCSNTVGSTYMIYENSTGMVDNIGNNSVIYLSYYPLSYLESGWSRTILLLVPGFFSLGLLGCALALFYGVARDTGILG